MFFFQVLNQLQPISFTNKKNDGVNMSWDQNMPLTSIMVSRSLQRIPDNLEDLKTSLKKSVHFPDGNNLEGKFNVALYQPNCKWEFYKLFKFYTKCMQLAVFATQLLRHQYNQYALDLVPHHVCVIPKVVK